MYNLYNEMPDELQRNFYNIILLVIRYLNVSTSD